jgi:hypothetical protein
MRRFQNRQSVTPLSRGVKNTPQTYITPTPFTQTTLSPPIAQSHRNVTTSTLKNTNTKKKPGRNWGTCICLCFIVLFSLTALGLAVAALWLAIDSDDTDHCSHVVSFRGESDKQFKGEFCFDCNSNGISYSLEADYEENGVFSLSLVNYILANAGIDNEISVIEICTSNNTENHCPSGCDACKFEGTLQLDKTKCNTVKNNQNVYIVLASSESGSVDAAAVLNYFP